MITRKIRWDRRKCIICVGEVNVIITYIVPYAFVIIKYSSVFFTSSLLKIYNWFSNYLKLKIIFVMFLIIIQNLWNCIHNIYFHTISIYIYMYMCYINFFWKDSKRTFIYYLKRRFLWKNKCMQICEIQ